MVRAALDRAALAAAAAASPPPARAAATAFRLTLARLEAGRSGLLAVGQIGRLKDQDRRLERRRWHLLLRTRA
jgi:hypothetical protein